MAFMRLVEVVPAPSVSLGPQFRGFPSFTIDVISYCILECDLGEIIQPIVAHVRTGRLVSPLWVRVLHDSVNACLSCHLSHC